MNLLVIGGSAGSLSVVLQLLPCLKAEWDLAVLVVFHRRDDDDNTLVEILSHRTCYALKEVEDKEPILTRTVYIAPPDYHVLIEKEKSFSLDYSEKINYCRPSIDATFDSAADAFGESLVAMLLSGANADGVSGLDNVRQNGGLIVIQDPATAEVPYMPRAALDVMAADFILDPKDIGECLFKLYERIE